MRASSLSYSRPWIVEYVLRHGPWLRTSSLSSCDELAPPLFSSAFLSSPSFPFRRAGVWSHYFQIATARSHVAKTSFSLSSGSFKDSLKIAPKLSNASPARPGDVTRRDSRGGLSIRLFYTYKNKPSEKPYPSSSNSRAAEAEQGRDLSIQKRYLSFRLKVRHYSRGRVTSELTTSHIFLGYSIYLHHG